MRLSVTVAYNKSDLALGWSHSIYDFTIFIEHNTTDAIPPLSFTNNVKVVQVKYYLLYDITNFKEHNNEGSNYLKMWSLTKRRRKARPVLVSEKTLQFFLFEKINCLGNESNYRTVPREHDSTWLSTIGKD